MKQTVKTLSVLLAAMLLAGCGRVEKADSAPAAESVSQAVLEQADSVEQAQPESASQAAPEQINGMSYPAPGISPITGKEAAAPGQRPVAVMLYNTRACRPQWGITDAALLIEANTEGQGTMLMAVLEGTDLMEKVGPVGPARDVYLQMVMPFGAIPMFNGCDAYTSNLLNTYAYQPIDGHYAGVTAFDYDSSRRGVYAPEYGWYAHSALMDGALGLYGQSAQGDTPSFFNFSQQTAPQNENGGLLEIVYGSDRAAYLTYNGSSYVLSEAGDAQVDETDPENEPDFDNVVLLMARSGLKDNWVNRDYDLTQGTALYLYGGGAKALNWQKAGPAAPVKFYDAGGSEVGLMPGRTYLGIWGGFEGQYLRLLSQNGTEQPLPALPEALPLPAPSPEPRDAYAQIEEQQAEEQAQAE